jgi:hypothetical protein
MVILINYPAAELRSIKRHFHLTPMQSIEEFFGLKKHELFRFRPFLFLFRQRCFIPF